jgi:hypothetical protein
MANNCGLAYLLQQHLFQMAHHLFLRRFVRFYGFLGAGKLPAQKTPVFFLIRGKHIRILASQMLIYFFHPVGA